MLSYEDRDVAGCGLRVEGRWALSAMMAGHSRLLRPEQKSVGRSWQNYVKTVTIKSVVGNTHIHKKSTEHLRRVNFEIQTPKWHLLQATAERLYRYNL